MRSPNLSVDVLAIAAAGLWLLAFGWCAVVTSRLRPRAGAGVPGPGLAPGKPALVNLSVTRCRLNGASPGPGTPAPARGRRRLVTTAHQPKASSHRPAAAIASTSTDRFGLLTIRVARPTAVRAR